MKNKKTDLIENAIEENLRIATDSSEDIEVRQRALKDAIEISKLQSDIKKDFYESIIKTLGVAIPIVVLGVNWIARFAFAKAACNFEKENSFTTMAGKSLSSIFRFD